MTLKLILTFNSWLTSVAICLRVRRRIYWQLILKRPEIVVNYELHIPGMCKYQALLQENRYKIFSFSRFALYETKMVEGMQA